MASPSPAEGALVVGADLSEALYAVEHGAVYRRSEGTPDMPWSILAREGYRMARIRINVDPPDNPSYAMFTDLAYAVRSARVAREAGLWILVDLHLSHWWADPGNQWTPLAWRGGGLEALAARVEAHVSEVLRGFRAAGIEVEAVQVGNEVSNGLLWPLGGPYREGGSWAALARLLDAGIGVVRRESPAATVLHLASGGDPEATLRWIASFRAAGGHWGAVDVVGARAPGGAAGSGQPRGVLGRGLESAAAVAGSTRLGH